MYFHKRIFAVLLGIVLVLLLTCIEKSQSLPRPNDDQDIIVVEEVVRSVNLNLNSSATEIVLDELDDGMSAGTTEESYPVMGIDNLDNDPTAMLDTAAINDDLVFLAKQPQQVEFGKVEQQLIEFDHGTHQPETLICDEEQDSLYSKLTAVTSDDTETSNSAPPGFSGIELQRNDHTQSREAAIAREPLFVSEADAAIDGTAVASELSPIDMSDFLALIPAAKVKSIVINYYRRDPEVQRAYTYLNGGDFKVLRQHIITTPEISAFLKYMNASGFDVMAFVLKVANLTNARNGDVDVMKPIKAPAFDINETVDKENFIVDDSEGATEKTMLSAITTGPLETTSTKGDLSGLHALVDSVLETLPQDQLLATFFDKLESDEQFAMFVNRIGTPAFAKILHNIQNSLALRNLIFNLHNNGVHVPRILESLKAYFFLGTF